MSDEIEGPPPFVGGVVHFVGHAPQPTRGATEPVPVSGPHRAAIITYVDEEAGTVNLAVFHPRRVGSHDGVQRGEGPGTWHWPEGA